jgi:hypothetical protein
MTLLAASIALALTLPAGDNTPTIVQAGDSPVKIDHAKIFNIGASEPAVLMYSATNLTDHDLEHFTIIAYIFDAQGTLKAKQTAPGRHMLEKRTSKFSTMVLDGWAVSTTDRVIFGVNQAQQLDSQKWWRAELEDAAMQAVKK